MPQLTLENAFFFSLMIASFGLVISSFENLFNWKVFSSSGLLSWKVTQFATHWTSRQKLFDFLFKEKSFPYFLYFSFFVSVALFVSSCFRISFAPILFLELMLLILFSFRTFYGLDGAYHMNLVVLFASFMICVFGIHSHIALLCMWFVAGQLVLSYFIAGIRKLLSPVWQKGIALELIFRTEAYGHNVIYNLVQTNKLLKLTFSWGVILWETLFPLILFLDMTWVFCFLAIGFVFHLMNAVFMGLNNFFFAFLAAYPVFLYVLQDSNSSSLIFLVLFYLMVPIFLAAWLLNSLSSNLWVWGVKSAILLIYVVDMFLTGFWPFYCLGYIGRYFISALCIVAVVKSFIATFKHKNEWKKNPIHVLGFGALIVFSGFLGWDIFSALRGTAPIEKVIELEFPLKRGAYYIAQGGNDPSINHHFPVMAQRGALDIVKLNKLGMRANGLFPEELVDYNIFGEKVYSPVSGTIVKAVDKYADLFPLNVELLHPAGNHLVIKKDETGERVLLAHLLVGSLQVKEGDSVKVGQFLAKVGNSGNTSEPHLHVHCVAENDKGDYMDQAQPISMIFKGSHLVRNSIYFSD